MQTSMSGGGAGLGSSTQKVYNPYGSGDTGNNGMGMGGQSSMGSGMNMQSMSSMGST